MHGDLGGDNVRVDPKSGRVNGVLDWDSARPGDPAVDLAALRASLCPSAAWGLLLERVQVTAEELDRATAYAATFALQEALLGVEQGDDKAVYRGLADYSLR